MIVLSLWEKCKILMNHKSSSICLPRGILSFVSKGGLKLLSVYDCTTRMIV